MKIAFAYDAPYPWHVGGIEAMNYNEAEELARGSEVHYYTMRWPGMQSGFVKDGIRYHAWHAIDQSRLYRHGRRSIREAAFYAISMFRLFGHRFDFVIANAFPVLHLPIVRLYCRITGAKLIVEVAEVWDREYWRSYLGGFMGGIASAYYGFAIRGADFYVTISSTTTEKLVGMGIRRSSTSIFAPAIDDRRIDRVARKRSRSKTILFSGRLIKEKRVDKWLAAMKGAAAIDGGIRGVVIGKGPERASLEKEASRLGLSKVVRFRDFYPDQSGLYAELAGSSALLHMSEREGLGIVAIESIALGTPVILPSYTPLPKEIREMCVVAKEKDIPRKIAEIASSSDKSGYIRNRKNIGMYSKSMASRFYSRLFSRLLRV